MEKAIVLANDAFNTANAKTAHGLVRGSKRFEVTGVVDPSSAGKNASELLPRGKGSIPIFHSVQDALKKNAEKPKYCIVGVATHGGILSEKVKASVLEAIDLGLCVINGLHQSLKKIPEIKRRAEEKQVELIDIREPKTVSELHFWTGEILELKTPRIAVLGTDCALGKRTTTQFLLECCLDNGIKTEMIYTGQTGWLQGANYGFIFDSTLNDFVSGELEHAIIECAKRENPQLILIEGQSSLRNPSGPCGSEFLLSGQAKGVILQHAPGRKFFEGYPIEIGALAEEIQLIKLYGSNTLAICLNTEGLSLSEAKMLKVNLEESFKIPVVLPLEEGVDRLLPVVRDYIQHS